MLNEKEKIVGQSIMEAFLVMFLSLLLTFLEAPFYIGLPVALWAVYKGLAAMHKVHLFFKELEAGNE